MKDIPIPGPCYWEPGTALEKGLAATYQWIRRQYHDRKKGRHVVE